MLGPQLPPVHSGLDLPPLGSNRNRNSNIAQAWEHTQVISTLERVRKFELA